MNWILKSIGLIIVIIFFSYLNIPNKKDNNKSIKEAFGNYSYNECRNQGYTKEFCLQTPVSVLGPGYCLCRNGLLGFREQEFRGRFGCADEDIQIF